MTDMRHSCINFQIRVNNIDLTNRLRTSFWKIAHISN